MALSIKHARQLITHGRVSINGTRIKFPSYIVEADEEAKIGWFKGEPKKPEGPKGKHHAAKHESDVAEAAAPAEPVTEAAAEEKMIDTAEVETVTQAGKE